MKIMKIHLMVVMLAVMILVMACSASPGRASTATTTASLSPSITDTRHNEPTQGTDLAWQVYTNAEVGFSIHYPYSWELDALPDENGGQLHRMELKGPEGGVELVWGVGLGGACPEGYKPLEVAQEELPACHSQKADGTEQWSLAGKQLGQISFSAVAYTNNTAMDSREIVLQILSTLSFP
jgi:hypothetical protein